MKRRTLKRHTVLCSVVMAGVLAATVAALQQPPAGQQAPRVVEVDKLKDNLYVLKGGGGNTAVFLTTGGVVVVDTKNPGWGQPILEKIRTLTDKPVTMIINTHTHGDHVSGNVEFPATVDVVTHENARASMEKMPIFKEHSGRGLPKRTFKDRMTLGAGNDRIDLHYFGRGHTNGDAWVVFPALRVMHAGDIFSGKNVPFLDGTSGGSGVDIGNTLAKAAAVPNIDSIISGHSTIMTVNDLKEYAEFNREFLAAVQAGKKMGRTIDEIAASWTMPAKYAGYAAPQPARLRGNVEVIYNELR